MRFEEAERGEEGRGWRGEEEAEADVLSCTVVRLASQCRKVEGGRNVPPSTAKPAHPNSRHPSLQRFNLDVSHPHPRKSSGDIDSVDPEDGVRRPAARIDRVAVDKDEERDDPDVVQGEEDRVRVLSNGAGRGEGDEEEGDEGADSALLFVAREELGYSSRGDVLFRLVGLASCNEWEREAHLDRPEVEMEQHKEDDDPSHPAMKEVDARPSSPRQPRDRAILRRKNEQRRNARECEKAKSIRVGAQLRGREERCEVEDREEEG